jgi:hypothetical protein
MSEKPLIELNSLLSMYSIESVNAMNDTVPFQEDVPFF